MPPETSTKGRVPTGFADEIALSSSAFKAAHRAAENQSNGNTTLLLTDTYSSSSSNNKKRKREAKGDSSVVYGSLAYKGPWAGYKNPIAPEDSDGSFEEIEVTDSDSESLSQAALLSRPPPSSTSYQPPSASLETTTFHGSEQYDYQGRTYMHVPRDLSINLISDPFPPLDGTFQNFVPKTNIHVWKTDAHSRPVTALRFFPSSGHLLLSSGADGFVKIFDAYHSRELLRSYDGHARKQVVDVQFFTGGNKFVSAGYDRFVKVWDTEVGTCTWRGKTGGTPHCVTPFPDGENEILVGQGDKKIVQFDCRIQPNSTDDDEGDQVETDKKVVQEYDHHLGPVNSLIFYDQGRRFLSTSDDRSLRAWEYGIPVPIKFIADPSMFALTRGCMHPSGKYVAYQSGDNQIVVYSVGEKVRLNRKKGYRGHNTAGYAINLDISPDGSLLMSGDTSGSICFWDWKTGKMVQKLQASDGAVVASAWHPRETSKVVTAGLDGSIKYWD